MILRLARRAHVWWLVSFVHFLFADAAPAFADFFVGTAFESGVRRIDETTGESLLGGVAPGSAGLFLTSGVAVGPDGNLYVSSRGTGEILFFDGDTGFPLPSPHLGGRDGLYATLAQNPNSQSAAPGPLRFGPDGHIYVSDFNGTDVRKVNGTTGVEMAPAASAFVGPPAGLTFDASGNLYFGDFGSASVIKVTSGVPSIFVPPQSGGLQTASSLLFLPDGDLIVVDLFGNQILKYDETGQNPSVFAVIPPEIPNPLPPGANFPSNNPSDIALDSNGDLVVAVLGLTNPPDNRGAILRYDIAGGDPDVLVDMDTQFGSIARVAASTFLFGDYDRSGEVLPADRIKWAADFGKVVTPGDGADGNGNGVVDAADYAIWQYAYDSQSNANIPTAVPEPATTILAIVAALIAIAPRRAHRRYPL